MKKSNFDTLLQNNCFKKNCHDIQTPYKQKIIFSDVFSAFSREKRKELLKRNPEMKPIQVMNQIEYLWQNLPYEEKQKYNPIEKPLSNSLTEKKDDLKESLLESPNR